MYEPRVIDPSLQDHIEEMRKLNEMISQAMPDGVGVDTAEGLAAARAGRAGDGGAAAELFLSGPVAGAEDRTLAGPRGEIRLHVLRPPEIEAVYLHIHGGGWALGTPEMSDATNWSLAQHAKVAVVSVDYRLAPEHPYPAGPDDCEAAAAWLLANAVREFGTERLLIGGESAGAHLSAVTLLRIRDRLRAIHRVEGANLVFGAYDLSLTPSQRDPRPVPVLSPKDMDVMPGYFLPGLDREQRRDPDISPLYADLSGLPPALFSVGTKDRLLDDTLFMAARWHAAGNATELAIYPEAPHGFSMMPCEMARICNERIESFLRRIVSPAAR